MSYKHSNAVRELGDGVFGTSTERYVMIEAAHYSDNRGILRMSQVELAGLLLISPRTLARQFQILEEAGLLIKVKHGRYQVNVDSGGDTTKAGDKQAGGVKQEIVKWIKASYIEEAIGFILEDKEIPISEEQEDESVVKRAHEAGLLDEIRQEDNGFGELVTIYRLNL